MAHTLDDVLRVADDPKVQNSIVHLLTHLMAVDTTVGPDLERVQRHEEQVLDLCAQAVETFLGTSEGVERVPIDPRIESHPYYTPAHYTKTSERPDGLGAADAYKGRSNLVVRVPGQGRGVLAFNAHVDVVAPYLEPRVVGGASPGRDSRDGDVPPTEGGVVFGRGACDDKGQCAAMLFALYLIEHARWMCGLIPPADLLLEFAIDEEPGGNGSLSLALDRRFAFDAMVVLEATNLAVHPGNRGAVWYRLDLDGSAAPGLDLVGLAAACVLGLEREGAALKAESTHPLFPHRPVQTCHGILGPWGKHPSAVNDHVELGFAFSGDASRLRAVVDQALAAYCAAYGDKTKEPDPETGKPKVDHHYDLTASGNAAHLVLHGKAGHMGAILRCDDAITKAAYVIRALEEEVALEVKGFSLEQTRMSGGVDEWMKEKGYGIAGLRCPSIHPPIHSSIHPLPASPAALALEGGQGFLPTHTLEQVTARMRQAVARAAEAYCRGHGVAFDPRVATMTFDKLHNDAFARDPSRPAVRAFADCVRAVGIPVEEPLRGWDVSCDARIFAREYPDSDVLTFGAGALEHAHSAQEQVRVADLVAAAKAIARFALTYEPRPRDA
ncbi:MAG TPA: M20/M25/M40 family metallo-hydrolase [Planctomycetota bacterium]|nr:M20/M25/M40 family metallo-hydrolase [Planctomycetota bacterium]HRR80134.1 M20/M25/M40 family metallo-hydrolase [Planctomycetota bacterium]HRT94971.1 M20/M25/M40 family metallo-hydrolase [Planctomycetota bacterium]